MTDPKDWNIPDMVAAVIADDPDAAEIAESLTQALQDVTVTMRGKPSSPQKPHDLYPRNN
jgi:hypothetical protein